MSDLYQIDLMPPWSMGHKTCPVCDDMATQFVGSLKGVHACRNCFQKSLETNLIRANIKEWTWERFSLALSSLGTMQDRLLALIHFRRFQSMERVPDLLIENLGFQSSHPLSQYVRQKAYEACVFFTDRQKILETLLALEAYNSWQQKANLVMVAYEIDPSHPKVQEFITHCGKDLSPNVRKYVAQTIQKDKSPWAKKLFQKLKSDTNLLVREACGTEGKNQGRTTPRVNINPIENPKPLYSRTEAIVLRSLDFKFQQEIYERYLSHIPELLNKKKHSKSKGVDLQIHSKDSCVRLLAAALEDESLFHTILEKLPKPVVLLLYMLAFEYEQYEFGTAEQKLFQFMEDDLDKPVSFMALESAVKKDPDYFMFQAVKDWFRYTKDPTSIAINTGLESFVRKLLPVPKLGGLVSLPDIQERVDQIHTDHQAIFRQLPIILSFIAQGNLKYNKTGTKILTGSLKKMALVCKINEFYQTEVNELKYLKTKLVGEFFNCIPAWKPEELKDLPGFIKQMILQYFSFTSLKTHRSRDFFGHISRQMREYDSNGQEKEMREDFKTFLNQLPQGKWVSIYQLVWQVYYHGMDFNPFEDYYEFKSLYISISSKSFNSFQDKQYVSKSSVFDLITLPYVQAMMFLMGALGVVDLGYSAPENTICRKQGKPWLTVFDGLKYVRLTEFGAYLLGGEKSFSIDLPVQTARIEVDEYKPMVSLFGDDPIKQMALESLGQQINGSTYLVTYQSFLRECHTREDVENKIIFFRDHIAQTPPPIWENFFKEVRARMEPLEAVPAMAVFRVKPDRELLSLLTTDPVLKKLVVRAENYHVVVRSGEVTKLKKRLAFLGFFAS